MSYSDIEEFPQAVEFQTISSCNAGCIICPHPEVSPEMPAGIMSDDLFKKIVDELSNYPDTRIIPYLNSEPFLDPDFIDKLVYIDNACPHSNVELSTNLSRLDEDTQNELADVEIHDLRMSVFGFTEETYSEVMPRLNFENVMQNLLVLVRNEKLRKRIDNLSLTMIDYPNLPQDDVDRAAEFCRKHEIVFNYWGFLDRSRNVNEYSNEYYNSDVRGCEQDRPLKRFHVNWQGQAILCCQDWRWEEVVGKVTSKSIKEIWNSEKYEHYRELVYSEAQEAPELCKKCKLSQ